MSTLESLGSDDSHVYMQRVIFRTVSCIASGTILTSDPSNWAVTSRWFITETMSSSGVNYLLDSPDWYTWSSPKFLCANIRLLSFSSSSTSYLQTWLRRLWPVFRFRMCAEGKQTDLQLRSAGANPPPTTSSGLNLDLHVCLKWVLHMSPFTNDKCPFAIS